MTALSPLLKQATPVTIDHALGSEIFDVDGNRHLDFTAGIGVVSTGHCHPKVVAAAQALLARSGSLARAQEAALGEADSETASNEIARQQRQLGARIDILRRIAGR